jgi:phage head maturation protease
MKHIVQTDKLLPVLEDKLSVKFRDIVTGSVVQRKQADTSLVIDDSEANTIIAKISTIDVDRSGEVVIPEGMDATDFMLNSLVCWSHNYTELPIGKITKFQVTDKAVYAKIVFGTTERCQEIYKLVREGILSACSIGFVAKEALQKGSAAFTAYVSEHAGRFVLDGVKRIITKWTLLENSIVAIPCNPEAVVVMKSMGISEKLIKEFDVIIKEPMDDETDYTPVTPLDGIECCGCHTRVKEGYCKACYTKEEVPLPDNAGSTPDEAFSPSAVVKPEDVAAEVIGDIGETTVKAEQAVEPVVPVVPAEPVVEPVSQIAEPVVVEPVAVVVPVAEPVVAEPAVEPVKPTYWTVVSPPIEELAAKELKRRKGKLS